MSDKYTEEELEGLTDQEREALLEDDGADDVTDPAADALAEMEAAEAAAAAEADKGKDGGEDDAAKAAEEEAAAEAAAKAAAEAEGKDDKGGDDDEDEDGKDTAAAVDTTPDPLLNGDLPEDVEAKLTELGEQKAALDEKFDDGDLSSKEYRAEMDRLNKAEREIEQAQFKAQLSAEMTENQQRAAWKATVSGFLSSHPEYQGSQLRYQTLDLAVKAIAADEANASLTGAQILAKAHEQVQAEFGIKPAAAEGDDKGDDKGGDGKKPPVEEGADTSKTGKGKLPPNLGDMPAAAATETGNSKWGALDRLMNDDPIAYEEALERMSDSERDAYLAAQ